MVMTCIVNEKSSRKRIEEDPLLGPIIGPFNVTNKGNFETETLQEKKRV